MSNTTIKTQQNTQLPAGYKQTALGLIPIDWDVKKISDATDYVDYRGRTPQKKESGILLLTARNIKKGYIDYEVSKEFISNEDYSIVMSRGLPEIGDVLITTEAPMGNVAQINRIDIALAQRVIKFRAKPTIITNDYLKYYLLSEKFQNLLDEKSTGGTAKGIKGSTLHKMGLITPPLPEQQKIAEILSTWDNAIDNCKKIIKKLKKRNKGLAQQLLTGKTRVKGFEDMKWTELKANKIFKSHTDKTHNGDLEILSATQERGVIPRSMNNIDIKFDENSLGTYKKVEIGDFVISLRSFQGGIEYSEYEGIVSPAYTILKEILPISKSFYKVYFKTETFINRLNTIIYGIRDGKQISFGDFSTLNLPYPSIEEQEAITLILNASNEELKQYEQKLANLQLQKKGLMQQLLTGKVRVKI